MSALVERSTHLQEEAASDLTPELTLPRGWIQGVEQTEVKTPFVQELNCLAANENNPKCRFNFESWSKCHWLRAFYGSEDVTY
jgi:hypothetical protein